MLAMGLDPTPEELARFAEIPLEHARIILAMEEPPPLLQSFAKAGIKLRVRLTWWFTGQTVMAAQGTLTKADIDVLSIVAGLDDSGVRKFVRVGKMLSKL